MGYYKVTDPNLKSYIICGCESAPILCTQYALNKWAGKVVGRNGPFVFSSKQSALEFFREMNFPGRVFKCHIKGRRWILPKYISAPWGSVMCKKVKLIKEVIS